MNNPAGKTAVLYSCMGVLDLDAHEDHLIPLRHWCRANGIKVVGEFKDDIPCDVRHGFEDCVDRISEGDVDFLIVDSMDVLGGCVTERFSAIRTVGGTGTSVRVVDKGDPVPHGDDRFPRCLMRRMPDNMPNPHTGDMDMRDDDENDGAVDVEPDVEQTDDHITFTFLVPKGVTNFTIRIREVD